MTNALRQLSKLLCPLSKKRGVDLPVYCFAPVLSVRRPPVCLSIVYKLVQSITRVWLDPAFSNFINIGHREMFPIDFGVSRIKVKVTVTVTKQHWEGDVLFYKRTCFISCFHLLFEGKYANVFISEYTYCVLVEESFLVRKKKK